MNGIADTRVKRDAVVGKMGPVPPGCSFKWPYAALPVVHLEQPNLHSGHLAWNHLRQQRDDLASFFWPLSDGYGLSVQPGAQARLSGAITRNTGAVCRLPAYCTGRTRASP